MKNGKRLAKILARDWQDTGKTLARHTGQEIDKEAGKETGKEHWTREKLANRLAKRLAKGLAKSLSKRPWPGKRLAKRLPRLWL